MPGSSTSERETALFGRGHQRRGTEDVERGGAAALLTAGRSVGNTDFWYEDMPFEVATSMSDGENEDLWGDVPAEGRCDASDKLMHGDGSSGHVELDANKIHQQPWRSLRCPVPFTSWTEQFVRQLLSARTRFSYFVMRTISASRSGRDDYTATALFPIPFPFEDLFRVGPVHESKRRRHSRAVRKLVHMAVMAFNFEYFRKPMSILALIRRRPSSSHLAVYRRIWTFIKACGPPAQVSISGCGRKSFQLDARMNELVRALDNLGLDPASKYHGAAVGEEVPEDNDAADELRPYRPLKAERIRLTGTGSWHCEDFLSDLLYMPFVEPDVNRFDVVPPEGGYPNVLEGDSREIMRLCKVWDAKSLLWLVPCSLGPKDHELFLHTRVFGNFKNATTDRQIGDRRGRNFVEGRLTPGPSHEIPNATALLQLSLRRFDEVLVGAVADRRDFYHQFSVPYERIATNTVYPPFTLADFSGTTAYERFVQDFGQRKREEREKDGDFLGVPKPLLVHCNESTPVFAAFGALFQGDHLGVEIACCSHGMLLEEAGCHPAHNRLSAVQSIVHNGPVGGLVIDDYFCVSAEPIQKAAGSKYEGRNKAREFLDLAKQAYEQHGILGSDDKEVADSLLFKVIGAEVNSTEEMARNGLVSLGAPGEKRFGLMMLSAVAANLPYTSDALHSSLVGSWISALLYRRPMMAHMNELFQVIAADQLNTERSSLRPLSRSASQELLVLACLAPLAASNLAAPFSDMVFASDASTAKGGLVPAQVSEKLSRSLWRTAGRKNKNPQLPSRTAALHRIRDDSFEEVDEEASDALDSQDLSVVRPIGLRFDFIEVCGGAGVVTKHLIALGAVCGPVLGISYSRRYDVTDRRVFSWLAFMCEEGRLKSFLAAPPCTTFSPAAYPCLRSYTKPLGYDPCHPRVVHGNDMAFSCIGLLLVGKRTCTAGMLETTRRSKLRWTPQWRRMRSLGADEVHLASCAYGSPHQKEFALMTVCMRAGSLRKKRSRDHSHVRIQGKFTKPSATYCEGLAKAIAKVFALHLRSRDLQVSLFEVRGNGLEDVLTNEVLLSQNWQVVSSWSWKGSSHINILETASALRAYEHEALRGGDLRFVSLIDSNVALRALRRGRTSSLALRGMLKRASSLSLAFGLYQAGRFAPSRPPNQRHCYP